MANIVSTSNNAGPVRSTTDVRAMSIATALFFMWGLLTSMNDILIPHLKSIFELTNTQSALVQFAFFSSFFLFALPAGKLVEWRGYKQTMILGLVIMAAGCLLFLPAASVAVYGVFLTALVVLAAGVTCLQVAANPYVTALGPQKTAASRLNFSQALNSLGTILGPLLGGMLILGATELAPDKFRALSASAQQAYRAQQASTVRLPYLGIAVTLLLLAAALAFLKLPTLRTEQHTRDFRPATGRASALTGPDHAPDTLWNHPWLFAGALGIFVYVGAEVSIGSFLINYFELPNIAALTAQQAAKYVGFYWAGAMVGRFIGSALLTRFRTGMVLGFTALIAASLVLVSMSTGGHTAMFSILAVGLFNSVMFPNIFSLGLSNLGELTSKGSSLMIASIVGGALLPLLQGKLSDRYGLQHAFIIPVLCYLYIALFGFAARKLMTSSASLESTDAA